MGGLISKVKYICKNIRKNLFKTDNTIKSSENNAENNAENKIVSGYLGNSVLNKCISGKGYSPPPETSKNQNQNILTSDNFKEYLSRTTKDKTNQNSNLLSEHTNLYFSNSNYENFSPSPNVNKIPPNSRNKNIELFNLGDSPYNTFPGKDKIRKKAYSEQKKKCVLDDFEFLKLLGKGTFGKVILVRNKKDFKLYAMKVLKKYRLFKTNQIFHTKTEREILEKINHPFIVKLHFAFQTELKLYLVTEFMQGGELFFHLKREKMFIESKVKAYVCEIVLAIEHLHKNKIIYRDLKPENILLDVDGHIKLADFGLSKFFNNKGNSSPSTSSIYNDDESTCSDKAFTLCGTPEYLAPEILTGQGYDKSVDWWSLGVLIYEMLLGSSPFNKRRRERLDLNYYTPVEIKSTKVSDDAKDLILSLLKNDPNVRLRDANVIKSHSFFQEVDWDEIINKKVIPVFIPKAFLRCDEDLCCFDENFTTSSFSDSEMIINGIDEVKQNGIKEANLNNQEIGLNFSEGKLKVNKIKKLRDDFENFSFTREDIK